MNRKLSFLFSLLLVYGSAVHAQEAHSPLERRFKALGLHSNQSPAEVKIILQHHGFKPWQCSAINGGTTMVCIATNRQQDELRLFFRSNRALAVASYQSADNQSAEDVIAVGPQPF
jgi:hypothetical protein